jgi:uncharacterized protein
MSYSKPLPDLTEPTMAPFWMAAREHRLVMQRCDACSSYRWPPAPICPDCLEPGGTWTDVEPRGTIWSYVVYHRAFHPSFKGDLPYVVGEIELEIGVRLDGAVVDEPGDVAVALPVVAVFDDVTPEVTLVKWRVATEDDGRGCRL